MLVAVTGCLGATPDSPSAATPGQTTPAATATLNGTPAEPNATDTGQNGAADSDQSNQTAVAVRGVISQTPYSLSDPLNRPAVEGPVTKPHGTTLVVRSVTDGPSRLRDRTVLVRYSGYSPGRNTYPGGNTSDAPVGPARGDMVRLNGTYNPATNRIRVDRNGFDITIVDTNSTASAPRVVGTAGDTVSIDRYTYGYDFEYGSNMSYRGTTIRLEDDETATVVEGQVRYGNAFPSYFGGPTAVITERPDD